MTPIEQESTINGAALRLARETRGWALSDMATRSCMSTRQIRQLEEGGTSSFYSASVKLTAVKKVGTLLGLPQEQWFIASDVALSTDKAVAMVSQAQTDALTNVSAISESQSTDMLTSSDTPVPIAPSQNEVLASMPKAKVSLWAILGLFAAALGLAALMRPAPESVATESVPPPVLALPNSEQEAEQKAVVVVSGVMPVVEAVSAAVADVSASAASKPAQAASSNSL